MKFNSCNISGNAGKDAEIKYIGSANTPLCEISIAIDSGYGERKNTIWTKLVIWGKAAEFMSRACKGDTIVAIGAEYTVDSWEKDGVKQYKHFFTASLNTRVSFISKGTRVDSSVEYKQPEVKDEVIDDDNLLF